MNATASPVETVLSRLPDARKSGNGWQAKCPAHDDRKASLCIGTGDGGAALIRCQAGCSVESVTAALGLNVRDLFPPRTGNARIVAQYDYTSAEGELLYQVCRLHPKDFRQRRPDGSGGWEWKLNGVRRVLYRLGQLVDSREDDPDGWVFIVEGEKDADKLAAAGLTTTCNVGGAGKWRDEYSETLRGRRVAIVPDNDPPGAAHAEQVAASCTRHGTADVRIVRLPNLPDKGDASDWLASGGDAPDLLALVEAAPTWKPRENTSGQLPEVFQGETRDIIGPVLTCYSEIPPIETRWLWHDHFPAGRISLLAGRQGIGKSFVTADFVARVTTGRDWPDGSPCDAGSVILCTAEDGKGETIAPRMAAHGADVSRVFDLGGVRRIGEDGKMHTLPFTLAHVSALEEALKRHRDCRLVIIDPIGSFIGGRVDAHRDNEVRAVLAPVADLADRFGAGVLLIAHVRKAVSTAADDSVLGSRGFTGIARSVWHLSFDKDDRGRRLLLPGKCNLCATPPGLAFTITGNPPAVVWEPEPVQLHADDQLDEATPGPEPEARRAAEEWLGGVLGAGPVPSGDLKDPDPESIRGMAKDAGMAWRTIRRAADKLGIISERCQYRKVWVWRLPKSGCPENLSNPS